MGEIDLNKLRQERQQLLDEWYESDQHFDSPLLDRVRVLEKQIKEMENCIKIWKSSKAR